MCSQTCSTEIMFRMSLFCLTIFCCALSPILLSVQLHRGRGQWIWLCGSRATNIMSFLNWEFIFVRSYAPFRLDRNGGRMKGMKMIKSGMVRRWLMQLIRTSILISNQCTSLGISSCTKICNAKAVSYRPWHHTSLCI